MGLPPQEYAIIIRTLSKRLHDNGEGNENWRQIYKTMLVIEFLTAPVGGAGRGDARFDIF